MKVIQVICQNNDWPCVDADLPYLTSKVEDLVTFMAIFSNIDMTIHCRIMAFLLLIRYVTLWPWPLTFWPWTVVTRGGSRDQPCRQVGHHWKCVCSGCSHCAFTESRDQWVGRSKHLHLWNPRSLFVYSLYNFYGATMMIKGRFGGELHHYAVFWGKNNSKIGLKIGGFGGKMGFNF